MASGLALLALASIAGIALLGALATAVEPPEVPLSELQAHVGTTVRTQGRVLEPRVYDGGFTRFLLSDGNRTVPATSREEITLTPGDTVAVKARALENAHRVELELDGPANLHLIQPWREDHVPLRRLLETPWSYRASFVRTSGSLQTIGHAPWLEAEDGSRVHVIRGTAPPEPDGTRLLVDAEFLYEAATASFRLRIDRAEPLPDRP